ncbi:hypothetical protein PILCRDRAFT_818670 [Piloderma croceum F 1598]|uniref:BHLH domain-containing protein n=1 Tax=Piloderma croceum (strain F 1598) TaxID=765440 RepID=A0A0C3FIV3_PILCF|nr:hypothetical protein PILCRDRAFT_818670 [Piloderma croceum F 1598]
MSLLTPTESHAFQSFLTSMDYSDSFVAPEWNMYADINDAAIQQTAGKESLTKATKDLMSLDPVKWGNRQSPYEETSPHSLFHNNSVSPHTQYLFSSIKNNHSQPHHKPHSPSSSIAPLRTVSAPSPPHPDDVPSSSSSPASIPLSASPPTPFDYYPTLPLASKRPSQDESHFISNKRHRPSLASSSAPPPKPALLSPSQKKANHIQSEQKRRANIRRGYEALCDSVPALREAIRLEEEAGSSGSGNGQAAAGSKGKKKNRGKLLNDDGEKVDGRAGPRSENVVLQKTIDHIEDLLADRTELLARLNTARNSLVRGHPLFTSGSRDPLWEREWTGGQAAEDDEEDDDDE